MEKSNLKKLLATASAFAVIAGASTSASAVANAFITAGGPGVAAVLDTAVGGANTANATVAARAVAGDTLKFGSNNDTAEFLGGTSIILGAVDVNGKTGTSMKVTTSMDFGNIVDNTGGNQTTALRIISANTSALTGTDVSGLGNITLGTAGGAGTGTLKISADVTLKGTIDSDTTAGGILTVDSGKTLTASGNVGAVVGLATTTLTGDATFAGTLKSTAISLDGGTATFAGTVTGTITSTVNKGTINAAAIAGDLVLSNGGTATVTGAITAAGGASGHVTLGSDAKATLSSTVAGNVATTGSALVLGSTDSTNVAGNVSINTTNTTTNTLGDVGGTTGLVAGKLTIGNATGVVTVTDGTLNMGNAADAVTVNGGTVETLGTVGGALTTANAAVVKTVGNITGNTAASGTSTITATGTVGGTLDVTGSALFSGSKSATSITGATTINTLNDGTNTIYNAGAVTVTKGNLEMTNASGNVLLTAGSLSMNNATGGTVKITTGTLSMNNVSGGAVTIDGGSATINDVTGANAVTINGGSAMINSIVNDLTMKADATATVKGSITGTTTTAAKNTLTLSGAGTNTGAITNVGKIVVQGARTFANIAAPGTIALEGSGASLTVGASLGAGVVTSDSTSGHNVTATAAQTLTGSIGTATNPVNLIMNGDNAANINTVNFHGSVTTATDSQASLVFGAAVDATVTSAGTSTNKLKVATFTNSATVTNGFHVDATTVAPGKTATIGGAIDGNTFEVTGAASKAVFSDGAVLDVAVTTAGGGTGVIEFAGAATTTKAMGAVGNALSQVTFCDTAGKTATVGADITATNIQLQKGTVQLTAASKFTGTTVVTAGTIDLADKTLTQAGNMTINGATTIKSTLTAATTSASITAGSINFGANTVTGASGSSIVLDLADTGVVRKKGGGRTFTIMTGTTALTGITADAITAKTGNKLLNYTVAVDSTSATKTITLTEVDNAATYLKSVVAGRSGTTIDALTAAADGTNGAAIVNMLGGFASAGNTDKVTETIDRIEKGSVVASDTVAHATTLASHTLLVRAVTANMNSRMHADSGKVTGVAAGDEASRFGAWVNPFYARTNQSERNSFAGYKNEAYGASFGLDTKVNEDLTLGVAITASNSNIKFKDLKSGDRTKVNSLLFSVYNLQQLTENWFVSGSATFGTNDVENRAKRVSGTTTYDQATAKYSVTSFDLKQVFGYNYAMEQAVITPMVGAKYSRVNDASYTESGTGNQNLAVSTKSFNKFEVVAGVKATGNAYDLNGVGITPEAHAMVNYNMFNNSQKQSITLDGAKLSSISDKATRLNYNLGLGVSSEYGAMEYGATYDLQIANKRTGHQGALKVRVNF